MEDKKAKKNKKITVLYLVVTLALTWICQFMPILMGMDVENTSISSFDYASIFFGIGGVMPTLIGIIFVFVFYTRDGILILRDMTMSLAIAMTILSILFISGYHKS